MVSGEVPISPTIFDSHASAELKKNPSAPIRWVGLDPVLATVRAVGMAAKAPHPNASLLFLDALLGQQIQAIYESRGNASTHKAIVAARPNAGPQPKIYILDSVVDDYEKSYADWQKSFNTTFIDTKAPGT